MGFMDRLGKALVEKVPEEKTQIVGEEVMYEDEPAVDASLDAVRVDTLISDIYAQNDLTNENGIFKVEEVMKSLPKEMVTDVKRSVVQSILSSFGVTVSDVVSDGENRVEVLGSVLREITNDSTSSVSKMEEDIEKLKHDISELETRIADEKEKLRCSTDLITGESSRVQGLIKFIGGE